MARITPSRQRKGRLSTFFFRQCLAGPILVLVLAGGLFVSYSTSRPSVFGIDVFLSSSSTLLTSTDDVLAVADALERDQNATGIDQRKSTAVETSTYSTVSRQQSPSISSRILSGPLDLFKKGIPLHRHYNLTQRSWSGERSCLNPESKLKCCVRIVR